MGRWIDADALDKRRIDYIVDGYAESAADMTEWGMAIIEAPSIDIVRCKECKVYMTDGYVSGCGFCRFHHSVTEDDDFCSCGERRE